MDQLKNLFEGKDIPVRTIPFDHEERFKRKLNSEFNKTGKKRIMLLLAGYGVAASVALFLFGAIMLKSNNLEQQIILTSVDKEIIEEEEYLKQQVNERLKIIASFNADKETTSELFNDINDVDLSLNSLREDFQKMPGDQRVVEAVINTYLLKIKALDTIVQILQKSS